ncbi:MAG: carboxypeptidase-like regulatory domain-containing protein [Bacteroidota bacterium]
MGQSLSELLSMLKEQKVLNYRQNKDQIILIPYKIKSYTINGVLKDAETGEHIIGASISILGTKLGTITNGYGYFSITLYEGTYDINVSHISYSSYSTTLKLNRNLYLKTSLMPKITQLQDIEISASDQNDYVQENIPSLQKIRINETQGQVPYFLGEVDVLQNALLQPGIKAIGEDASGIHVRGGSVDQNLILFDEATIYNPNHFFGLISVFNPEAVNDIRIMKGYSPPSYGGRASSVIEVRQKEGNNQKLSYSGGIGILSARGLIEGPIKKNKSSFLVSGRQSLLNLSLSDFGSSSVRRNRVRFQDLNIKLNTRPNTSNQFYLSGYYGSDRNAVGLSSVRRWGNRILNFRWSHLYSPQLFSNIALFVSDYNYRIENDEEPGAFIGRSSITDLGFKADFSFTFETSNEIIFGANSIFHSLLPGSREPFDPDGNSTNLIELDREKGLASALYLGHNVTFGNINLNYGFRYSTLHTFGPREVFLYESATPVDTAIVDTLLFREGELIESFGTLEPRLAINARINDRTSIKASFARNAQYIHLISNTIAPAPTDIWKLTDRYIPPLISDQYSLGLYKNFQGPKNLWEFSTEVYFKDITNNIQYRNGADLVFNENIETELIINNGRAYGLEVFLSKQTGKLTGWVSYSLSRAESRVPENDEIRFVLEDFDKTHDFSTSLNFKLSDRVSASSNFIYNTGIPVTLPTDKFVFEENLVPSFGARNNARIPDYHRLDLSLKFLGKSTKKNGAKRKNRDYWIFTIYNVYSRKNPYSYFFRESELNPGIGEIVQYSIFGSMIPAVTYNFKF